MCAEGPHRSHRVLNIDFPSCFGISGPVDSDRPVPVFFH